LAHFPARWPQRTGICAGVTAAALCVATSSLSAQDNSTNQQTDYLDNLKSCQSVEDDTARLACFDGAVSNMLAASDSGEVKVIDREDVRETRRSLFGFSLPSVGLFDDDGEDEEEELFSTTIERVRYLSSRKAQFTTAEGAVWEMKNIPRRLREIEPGDTVVFKGASMGYFYIRIDGQMGVKGRRIQ